MITREQARELVHVDGMRWHDAAPIQYIADDCKVKTPRGPGVVIACHLGEEDGGTATCMVRLDNTGEVISFHLADVSPEPVK